MNRGHLGVIHAGGAELNGNQSPAWADVVEHLVVRAIEPNLAKNIQVGKHLRAVNQYIEHPLPRRRDSRIGFREFEGHLVASRRHIESVGEGISVTLGLIQSVIGRAVNGAGDCGGSAARKV